MKATIFNLELNLLSRLTASFIALSSVSSFSLMIAPTYAAAEESETAESKRFAESLSATRGPASGAVVSGTVQARKRYPGGHDEDDLQVQLVLPNPSRGLEAHDAAVSEAAASSSGETSGDSNPPASD